MAALDAARDGLERGSKGRIVTMTAVMTLSADTPIQGGLDTDVALAAAGDASAFERLYRQHVGRIHGLTRRMLGNGEADR